jgi:hypothetical protein
MARGEAKEWASSYCRLNPGDATKVLKYLDAKPARNGHSTKEEPSFEQYLQEHDLAVEVRGRGRLVETLQYMTRAEAKQFISIHRKAQPADTCKIVKQPAAK